MKAKHNTSVIEFFSLLDAGNYHRIELELARNPDLTNCYHPTTRQTPLHIACQKRDETLAEILVRNGAALNGVALGSGTTVSEVAAWNGMKAAVRALAQEYHRQVPHGFS